MTAPGWGQPNPATGDGPVGGGARSGESGAVDATTDPTAVAPPDPTEVAPTEAAPTEVAPTDLPAAPAAPDLGSLVRRFLHEPLTGRAARELAYLAATTVLGLAGVAYAFTAAYVGALLALTIVGLPLVGLAVLGGRLFGTVQRALVVGLLHGEVAEPPPFRSRPGVLGFVRSSLADGPGWRGIAYLVVKAPLVAGGYLVGVWLAAGAVLATYPVWWALFEPENVDPVGRVRQSGIQLGEWYADTMPRVVVTGLVGLLLLWTTPWLVRGLVHVDRWLVGALLARSGREARVAHLAQSRTQAVVTADERLRRIERDLHDGAQARMAAVAMSLGQVQEDLADEEHPLDRERTRRLVDAAHANAMTAIGELRDLARGIHPPVLDVGLTSALTDLAATSPVAVELRLPPDDVRFPPEVESVVWFCAAELMANVTRHSGARRAVVDLAIVDHVLRLRVTDDGHGGAAPAPGSGLTGLGHRLAPVDGALDVRSPLGGPTAVTVEVPLLAVARG